MRSRQPWKPWRVRIPFPGVPEAAVSAGDVDTAAARTGFQVHFVERERDMTGVGGRRRMPTRHSARVDSVLDRGEDEGLQLLRGVVEGLGAALGAAHGHGPLDGRDDECRELSRLIMLGAGLTAASRRAGSPIW
ncbi:hypothetical protein SY2F82_36140 [Streptomyces sp. Y2F8-2]|nr:hypothetical protein SY2F82_36140 [Streptomyces sp. Y2F8-2]